MIGSLNQVDVNAELVWLGVLPVAFHMILAATTTPTGRRVPVVRWAMPVILGAWWGWAVVAVTTVVHGVSDATAGEGEG
tara:strand:+ start:350 stop:586 length:237 start_codon:yes stop_codon:yes gene_type:complete